MFNTLKVSIFSTTWKTFGELPLNAFDSIYIYILHCISIIADDWEGDQATLLCSMFSMLLIPRSYRSVELIWLLHLHKTYSHTRVDWACSLPRLIPYPSDVVTRQRRRG